MSWQEFTVTPPPGVSTLGSLISTGLSTFTSTLQAVKAALQASQAQAVDPAAAQQQAINAAIKAAVAAIKDLIDQILGTTGCYVLVIPIPKKSLIDPRTVTDDQGRNPVNPTYFPIGPFLNQLPPDQKARIYSKIDFAKLFDPKATNMGGNAYLIKTVSESLYDAGDIQRPRWKGSMYWGSCQLVVGSIDYTQIAGMLSFIDNLFSGATQRNQNLSRSQTSLVPQSVTATLAYPESTSTPAVVIEWPALPVGKILSAFESATLTPVRMAVIRSKDFRARNALRVTDLFSGDLSEGTTGEFDATVVSEAPFDGVTNRFVDTSELEEGKDYIYHVAFKTRLTVPGSDPVLNDYAALSPSIQLHYSAKKQAPQSTSVPPDWIRTPSTVDLIPPLAGFLTQVKTYLDGFAAGSQSFSDHQTAYTQFFDKQIAKYEAQATSVQHTVQRIVQILQAPDGPGAYVRFGSGRGPVADFLADVVESLTDQGDQKRPPFDAGTEFVSAIIFLAAGPDPTKVAQSTAFLKSLISPAGDKTPAQAAIAQITQAVATAEQAALDQLLGPTTPTPGSPGAAGPSSTFAPDGTHLPPGTPDPNCAT